MPRTITERLRRAERQRDQRCYRRRGEGDHDGPRRLEVAAREQAADRVAEGHPHYRERAEHLPLRLRADEQRDPDEANADAEEPRARYAHLAEGDERDQRVEDRHRRLDDRREAGVDPRLAPRQQPERNRRVDERDQHEHRRIGPELPHRLARADRERQQRPERQRGEAEPPDDQRRRLELAHCHLDEQERRSPQERQPDQHHEVPPARRGH
jgi:hypothetical protein